MAKIKTTVLQFMMGALTRCTNPLFFVHKLRRNELMGQSAIQRYAP